MGTSHRHAEDRAWAASGAMALTGVNGGATIAPGWSLATFMA
ncbi:MAG: hypothetical protein JWL83_4287, partial [Actinomycetia bacterium]|nr:hypothetical protein [Actinomycetes bacterium]